MQIIKRIMLKPFSSINETKELIAKHKRAIKLADYSRRLKTKGVVWDRVIEEGFYRHYADELIKSLPLATPEEKGVILDQLTGVAMLKHYLEQIDIKAETAEIALEAAEASLQRLHSEYNT